MSKEACIFCGDPDDCCPCNDRVECCGDIEAHCCCVRPCDLCGLLIVPMVNTRPCAGRLCHTLIWRDGKFVRATEAEEAELSK
jgi:hypothetical protein